MCQNVHVEGPLDEVIRGVEKCPARHNASVVEQQRYLRERERWKVNHVHFPGIIAQDRWIG